MQRNDLDAMLGFLKRIGDLDRLAMTLVLTGIGLIALHIAVFRGDEEPIVLALLAFYACEIAGFVCGLAARRTRLGRTAAWGSAFSLVASVFVLA